MSIVGDALDHIQAKGIVERTECELGGIDALVTIVGQASFSSVLDMTQEQWDHDHRKNLRSVLFIAREVARSLIARSEPGSIVCIASVTGLQSAPNHAAYSLWCGESRPDEPGTQHGRRVGASQFRVNAIAPGSIITPRIPASPERMERTEKGLIPTKRLGTAEEVGKAAPFLLSYLASYVTGHTLLVDGGWVAAYLLGIPHVPPGGVLDATAGTT